MSGSTPDVPTGRAWLANSHTILPMTWQEFEEASALERDMLERALPLVPTASDGTYGQTIDMDTGRVAARVGARAGGGPTPETCIEMLKIRPLLVGAAWKVIDLMFEEALIQTSLVPDTSRGWSIKAKMKHARTHIGCPLGIDSAAWAHLLDTYLATEDFRHSLVHRKAFTNSANSLVGVDKFGRDLRPMTAHEQESFVRAATSAALAAMSASLDRRRNDALLYQLAQLTGLHHQTIVANNWSRPPLELILPLSQDPLRQGVYPLDVPRLRATPSLMDALHADVIIRFKDRPGQELHGRLEDAPDAIEFIEPNRPPKWLT